jgi:hypothetical protein
MMHASPLSDNELIAGINDYMSARKFVTRGELNRKFHTSLDRMKRLEAEGKVKLPPKLSKSAGSTLSRKRRGLGNMFVINKPATWQVQS